MKKTYILLFSAALALAGACKDAAFLDQKPYSQTSPENFYSTEDQMKLALVSCYETINTHKIPGYSYCQRGSYAQGLLYIMNAPSDDVIAAQSSNDEGLEMEWGNYIESTRCIRDFWKVFYAGINRCNTILAYVDKAGLSDEQKLQYSAEARFMRAFFYYHLAWNWGGVPKVTDYASDGTEPRSSLEVIYDFILDDLQYAYDNLPASGGVITGVSANKYTAAAYIGRICNYLSSCKRNNVGADLVSGQPLNDFAWVDAGAMTEKARNALADVALNSPYSLVEDYVHLFLETTKAEQKKECLLLAELPLSGAEGYWPNSFYLPTPASNGAVVPVAYGGRHVPTPRPFYMYDATDIRRDHNLTGRITDGYESFEVEGYTYLNPRHQTRIKIVDEHMQEQDTLHPLYDSKTQSYLAISGMQLCPGKVRLAQFSQVQHTYQQHAFSYPLMRLADVYLMYAEALYFSGNEPEARIWMNKVLKRASTSEDNYNHLLAAYHRDNFIDELLESRERELIFEFSRKWDLIRFNRIDDAIASLNDTCVVEMKGKVADRYLKFDSTGYLVVGIPNLKANWSHYKIWLPISEEQRGVNQALTQNAGWGK